MLLKRRADLLIDGKYRRITIWDALDWMMYSNNWPVRQCVKLISI